MKLLYKGAEAELLEAKEGVIKRRLKKGYRHPVLDKQLRKRRTSLEARMLIKAKRLGLSVPRVLDVEGNDLTLEFVKGERVKDILSTLNPRKRESLAKSMGHAVASLHEGGIMHGDLTTSNMIVNDGLILIDFGLSRPSSRSEDQAVDLYLLYESLGATHPIQAKGLWKGLINAYKTQAPNGKDVLAQFEKIRKRRRYSKE